MLKIVIRYGVIAGFIGALPWMWTMLRLPADAKSLGGMGGMLPGYIIIIVALSMVFVGIKQYRDRTLGGVIKFGTAFLVGLGISAVASVVYAIGWELSMAFSKFDFAAFYARSIPDPQQARDFLRSYSNPLYRMTFTFIEMFPVGILVSLISAGVLRKRP